jgi:hypothetical protein
MRLNLQSIVPIAVPMALCFVTAGARASVLEIDPSPTVRGSLGVPIFDLSLDNPLGAVSFFLNAGFALLCSVVALYLVARNRPAWPSMPSTARTLSRFPFLRKYGGALRL